MNDTKFFFITICYNNKDGLKQTIASLKEQTYLNWNCLIIDGNSQDGTQEYLANLDNPSIKFISERDRGIYDAMNKGIASISDCDYFCFLNSGDALHNSLVLENLNVTLKNFNDSDKPKIIYGHTCESFPSGAEVIKPASSVIALQKGMFCHHQSMFFHQSLADLHYNLNYKLSADYDYIVRAMKRVQKPADLMLVDSIIARFDMSGASNKKRLLGIKEDFRLRIENGLCSSYFSAIYALRSISLMYLKRVSYPLYMLMRSRKVFTNLTT